MIFIVKESKKNKIHFDSKSKRPQYLASQKYYLQIMNSNNFRKIYTDICKYRCYYTVSYRNS